MSANNNATARRLALRPLNNRMCEKVSIYVSGYYRKDRSSGQDKQVK